MKPEKDEHRYMFGNPCEAAIRREENTKRTKMQKAFEKAKQLFEEQSEAKQHTPSDP